MKSTIFRHLVPFFCILVGIFLSGCCAAQKSLIVLLPEDGKVSGEVTVVTAQGAQLLSRSWQSVEIDGSQGRLESPVVQDETSVQTVFGGVMSAMPLPPVHYMLFFKLDSVELMPDSRLLLPAIVRTIEERHPAQLSVVGHTDSLDSVEYNYQLGLRRANAVSELLASLGAVPASVEISSRGKTDLLVKTPDKTHEPRNRRAEVTIR